MSTLSSPSQMYYGTSKNSTGFHKAHMHACMYVCPSCPSHPKCTMVPQRIPRNSIMYTCMYILCQAKLYVPSQMYYGFCKVHTRLHVSTLTIPSQIYYGTSKNPTEFHKAHMHARKSKLSIPSQMYYGTSKNPTEFCKLHSMYMYMCPSCLSHPKCTMAL